MKKLHALVLGATGATGQQLVALLLKDDAFSRVSILVRKNPHWEHPKLRIHEIDFSRLQDYRELVKGEVLFSALGTTLKDAGSKAQQYLVDYTYQFELAKMAAENHVSHYALVSSTGSNKKSLFFYPKMKGALEEAVKKLPFEQISIFQPPILIRQPHLMRQGEKVGVKIFKTFTKMGLFKSQKPVSVAVLAQKMINEIKSNKTLGVKIYTPKDIL